MKVGYFKVEPTVPVLSLPRDQDLSLSPHRELVVSPRSKWKLLTLPLTGFVLALILIGSLQVGVKLANYDLPKDRYETIAKIDLPSNVLFTASVYESVTIFSNSVVSWLIDLWHRLVSYGRILLGLERTSNLIVTTSKISNGPSSPTLFGGKLSSDQKIYAVMALPAQGVIEIDENLKQNLRQVFADPVDIKFDGTGRSGTITPILPGGRRGNNYVFVLTPAR